MQQALHQFESAERSPLIRNNKCIAANRCFPRYGRGQNSNARAHRTFFNAGTLKPPEKLLQANKTGCSLCGLRSPYSFKEQTKR